ncbi:MAG TPA: EAL domain-containing protein [Gammaproteobacteria bacterium]
MLMSKKNKEVIESRYIKNKHTGMTPKNEKLKSRKPVDKSTADYNQLISYVREKINQLLVIMGTLPLRPEELDDDTLLSIDPIGVIANSFKQILEHQKDTNKKLELANNEIETILNTVGLSIIVLDKNLNIELINHVAAETFTRHNFTFIGANIYDAMAECSCVSNKSFLSDLINSGKPGTQNDITMNNHIYDLIATPLLNENNKTEKIILAFVDTTERKETDKQLRLAAAVFESTKDAVVITDNKNNIIAANKALTEITGYTLDDIYGKNPGIFKSGKHSAEFYQDIWHEIRTRDHWKGEIWDRRKSGEIFAAWESISAVKTSNGEVSNYISIISDISLQKKSQEQLDFLAHHDALTGLPNRILFDERLTRAIEKAKRQTTHLGILFIDLDRFKNVNDTLGHITGDKLLVETARHLEKFIRKSDTVARLGGDEFIILLDSINSEDDAARFATKLINSFHEPFRIDDHDLYLTLSIGICICPEDGNNVEKLLKNADTAMYRAKEQGKNGFRFFTEELSQKVYEKLTLENYLRQAIDLQQFELYFQPQYSLPDKRLISAEALLRWSHPKLGMVSPYRFISLAEETGIIISIGEWVINQACSQLRSWRDKNYSISHISINVSGLQIQRGKLVKTMMNAIHQYDLEPNDIEIEITESIIMDDTDFTVEVLGTLKKLGFSIAIDDFGTGYSSLGYLKKLPVDKLKIDRSFIKDIHTCQDDDAIVRAIIALANNLQLTIVAEGIEIEEHHRILSGHGCQIAQGFYYSKPLPHLQFESLFNLR